ncbi:hypothetical protein KJ786_01435 [Patescibacteria group bacterium]|nr:hypothetical protein [Patescibacteria group bacterium]
MPRLKGKYPKLYQMPSFNNGQLVFLQSNHSLTFINGYYRCSLRQKGKCNVADELSFKYPVFERRLSRAIQSLKLDEEIGRNIFYEWDRQAIDLRKQIEKDADCIMQDMEATILVMKQEIKKTKKISMRNTKEARERYGKLVKITFPSLMHGFLSDLLKGLTAIGKTRIGDGLFVSAGFEKVYLSKEGKILKVKLQGMNDYLFQYVERKKPDFLKNLPFEIIEKIHFPSLNLLDAMNFFRNNNYKNVLSYSPFTSECVFQKQLKKQTDSIKQLPPLEQIKMWETLKDITWQSPHVFFSGLAIPYDENSSM